MKRLLLIPMLFSTVLRGQDASFQKIIQPFLSKNCLSCHSEKLKSANLSLEGFPKQPEIWDKVRQKLSTGKMPPPGQPAVSKTELAAVTSWIDGMLKGSAKSGESDPGRVTARRLNRVEYNNTIRDLLGVPMRPADEFPVDDSGYGFDNIGDVLSVSPMLMEKYMSAASRISRVAVFGESLPAKPTILTRLLNRRSPDVNDVLSKGSYLPYSMRGAMYGSWIFPVDGEYEFRLRIANFRGEPENPDLTPEARAKLAEERRRRFQELKKAGGVRRPREVSPEDLKAREEAARKAAPPRKLILTVDGAPVITTVIEGTTTFDYNRGEFTGRIPVKAGERFLRASYPELADLDDPRQNINPDMRRALFVDYLEIVGPFQASAAPPESYSRIFICGHTKGQHRSQCARPIVENLVRRAYRRAPTRQEVDAKLKLAALAQKEGDTFEEGIRLALEAILVSPNFLFRVERDARTPQAVSEYELASRLSYFLWASMPDEELFRAAGEQRLRKPGVLEAQVRRMMADPKSINLVDNFAAQWLQLRNLGRTKPDPVRFPTVDDELLDAMRRETAMFIEAIIREDRSILDFIDAPFTFLNGPLARHYGIPGINGEEFRRVKLEGDKRSGLLTQGAILTVSSYPTRTSPPVRGKWVLENLLGTPPPPPPADAPVLDESKLGTTVSMRERLEQHRKDPSCSPCHNLMDPIGLGLEGYDAVGAFRTHDGKLPIDSSGTLPDGKSFNGASGLKQILKGQSDAFTRNLTEKLLTFALGRGLEGYDEAVVEKISRKVAANDYRFSTIVQEIVNSKPFQMRSGDGVKQ